MLMQAVRTMLIFVSVGVQFAFAAENKCEVKTGSCVDARTGQPRVCSTTICKDDKGEIVSINTIVLKDAGGAGGTKAPKGKVELKELNVTKQLDKSTPK